MPVTINDYTYTVVDGDLTVARRTSKPRKVYPFERDNSVYTLEEDYMIFIDYYETLKPAEVNSNQANLYFVKDSPIRDIGNGVGTFTRKWATLPGYNENGEKISYIYSDWESYSFTVPGITSTQGLYLVNYASANSVSNGIQYITSTLAHDIAGADQGVLIYYSVVDPINGFTYFRYQTKVSLDGTAGSTLVINEIKDINTVYPISFQRAASNQEPYTKTVTSRIDKDYWLPNVSGIDSVDDIPIIQEFQIIDNATGDRTEYLNTSSPGTNPTYTEYLAMIEAGTWIAAEPSIIRPWQGEIYERSTRYVKATF